MPSGHFRGGASGHFIGAGIQPHVLKFCQTNISVHWYTHECNASIVILNMTMEELHLHILTFIFINIVQFCIGRIVFFKVELIFIDVSSDCLCKRRHCKLFHFPHIKFPLVHFFKKLNLLDYIKLEIFLLALSVSIFGQNGYRH